MAQDPSAVLIILLLFFAISLVSLVFSAFLIPLPVNDSGTVRYNSVPWVTLLLIMVNVMVFVAWQFPDFITLLAAQNEAEALAAIESLGTKIYTYGFRAAFLREGISIGAFSTLTSLFMHADFSHLMGNMIFLWAFGRRVEDACGPWRYLAFYVLAGMSANIGSAIIMPDDLPSIGASGAIAGVMGAFLVLFPTSQIDCLWGLGVLIRGAGNLLLRLMGEKPVAKWTIRLPTLFVLVGWIALNLIGTFNLLGSDQFEGGVNYAAHTLGFTASLAIFLFVRKDLFARYWAGRAV